MHRLKLFSLLIFQYLLFCFLFPVSAFLFFEVRKFLDKSTAAYERDLTCKNLLAPWIWVGDATTEELNSLEHVQKLLNFKVKFTFLRYNFTKYFSV